MSVGEGKQAASGSRLPDCGDAGSGAQTDSSGSVGRRVQAGTEQIVGRGGRDQRKRRHSQPERLIRVTNVEGDVAGSGRKQVRYVSGKRSAVELVVAETYLSAAAEDGGERYGTTRLRRQTFASFVKAAGLLQG